MDRTTREKVFAILYYGFSVAVPAITTLWTFVIQKLMDDEVSITAKWGIGGTFTLVICFVVIAILIGKMFTKKAAKIDESIKEINDKILLSTSETNKTEFINQRRTLDVKKQKIDSAYSIYKNLFIVAPFILFYLVLKMVEQQVISLRGTFFIIMMSLIAGLGVNLSDQLIKIKEAKEILEEEDDDGE